MFLQASVILSTGGYASVACWDASPPPGPETPLDQADPPPRTRQTPPGTRDPPPPDQADPPPLPGSRLQHMVNERPVRILLECILVSIMAHFHQRSRMRIRIPGTEIRP